MNERAEGVTQAANITLAEGGTEHADGGEEGVQGEDDKLAEGEGGKLADRDGQTEGGEGDRLADGGGGADQAEEGEGGEVMAATVILGPAELAIGIEKPLI